MAPSKKKGAVAPASKPVRRKKPSTPEREAKLKAWHDAQNAVVAQVKKDLMSVPHPPILSDLHKPAEWTVEMEEVFLKLVTLGIPVVKIAEREDMPDEYVIWCSIADERHNISRIYARGKQRRVTKLEEQLEIEAEASRTGIITVEKTVFIDGVPHQTTETRTVDNTERSKIRIDAIKWTLAHTRPKKHGRQPDTGSDGKSEQLDALVKALAAGPAPTPDDDDEDDD